MISKIFYSMQTRREKRSAIKTPLKQQNKEKKQATESSVWDKRTEEKSNGYVTLFVLLDRYTIWQNIETKLRNFATWNVLILKLLLLHFYLCFDYSLHKSQKFIKSIPINLWYKCEAKWTSHINLDFFKIANKFDLRSHFTAMWLFS